MIGINDTKYKSVDKNESWVRIHLRCRAGLKDAILFLCAYGTQEHVFKSKKEAKLHLASRAMFDFFPYDYRHENRFKETTKTKTLEAYEQLANKTCELQSLRHFNDLNADIAVWLTSEASGRLSNLSDKMGIPQTFVMRMCLLNCLSNIDELGDVAQQFCTVRFEKYKNLLDEHLHVLKQIQNEIAIIDTDADTGFKTLIDNGAITIKNASGLSFENITFLRVYIKANQIESIDDTFRWKK